MIINNVKLVLENEVVHGSLEMQDGEIRAFAESQSHLSEAMDGEGGWLLPGLIELHTDNLDKFFTPRPKVDWPAHSAMSSHDALMVASGITTVLDAVAIGDVRDGGDRLENLEKMINAIEETQKRGVNRAEHRLHLRCELPHHTTLPLFEKLVQREPVTLVSLMDHSPGQRQFANREKYREYYQGKYSLTDAQMQQYEEEQLALAARWSQPNRESIAAMCRARHIALASHDDATHAHVAQSHQLGSVIAEFPTTFEAAEASRKHGMNVLMGSPNIVRGGSHSGNVAASELAQLGLLDILSSDYYPASLLDAAFRVADDQSNRFTLPQDVVNKVFNITLRTIMEGQSIVNVDEIHRAARFFYQARQRDLYGAGGSNAICADVQDKFLRIGVRCQAYPDAHIMMMSASLLQEGDVVLVVTHSGRTSDVKAAVELAKKNGAKIICITHSYHSPIAKLADYIICSPAPETPLLGRNASARILQLTLLDAFFVSVAQLNIEQANINMQKTGAIVDFFSPGALK